MGACFVEVIFAKIHCLYETVGSLEYAFVSLFSQC